MLYGKQRCKGNVNVTILRARNTVIFVKQVLLWVITKLCGCPLGADFADVGRRQASARRARMILWQQMRTPPTTLLLYQKSHNTRMLRMQQRLKADFRLGARTCPDARLARRTARCILFQRQCARCSQSTRLPARWRWNNAVPHFSNAVAACSVTHAQKTRVYSRQWSVSVILQLRTDSASEINTSTKSLEWAI